MEEEIVVSTKDEIKNEVEKALDNIGKRKYSRLGVHERLRIIQDYQNGKQDKYYNVHPIANKPGCYRVYKRRKPLDIPEIEVSTQSASRTAETAPETQSATASVQQPVPKQETVQKSITPSELLKPKEPPLGVEFFSAQNFVNSSLQREIDSLHEKFNKLDTKMKESRKAKNIEKEEKTQPVQEPDEYEYEYVEEDDESHDLNNEMTSQQPVYGRYVPFIRRKQINILDF